jgi:hypothetical protein
VRPKLKVQTAVLLGQLLAVSVALGGGMLALTEQRTFARGLLEDPVAFWLGFLPWSSVGPVCEELFYRGFLQSPTRPTTPPSSSARSCWSYWRGDSGAVPPAWADGCLLRAFPAVS